MSTPPPASRDRSSSSASGRKASQRSSPRSPRWFDSSWTKRGCTARPPKYIKCKKAVPIVPFRILDAPSLRDDFYCSLIAYSDQAQCLAVSLGKDVYLWSEVSNADIPSSMNAPYSSYVTCIAFNNTRAATAYLAIGRCCGRIMLWGLGEPHPRFDVLRPSVTSALGFRPNQVKQPSRRDQHIAVEVEHLLLGDESGKIYLYEIEWPGSEQRDIFNWKGSFGIIACVAAHSQQICGLAWSSDAFFFATGGNDNLCFLFETDKIMKTARRESLAQGEGATSTLNRESSTSTTRHNMGSQSVTSSYNISARFARHTFKLLAAVKAIAFCPWQRGLLAIGGGSNDRCIHFYHTLSGVCLATIDCAAQVTGLIWSTTRREIVATFGFAQPEHKYRIAVFAWPTCECVVKIPWSDEHRALAAIAYPGGPARLIDNQRARDSRSSEGGREVAERRRSAPVRRSTNEGGVWWSRTQVEGCIVVATSDACIKFHEVWADEQQSFGRRSGLLGGSDILDSLHGIDKEDGQVIR